MNGLRSHIKNSKECFIRYPNTSKSVKKTRLRLVFSTHFSVFGYPDETLFLVFDILLEDSVSVTANKTGKIFGFGECTCLVTNVNQISWSRILHVFEKKT